MSDETRPTYTGRRVYRYTVLVDVEASPASQHPQADASRKLHAALAQFNMDNSFAGLACLNDGHPAAAPFDLEAHERARQVLMRHGFLPNHSR